MLGAYLVLAIAEGLILGLTIGFLLKVKPELLGLNEGLGSTSVR